MISLLRLFSLLLFALCIGTASRAQTAGDIANIIGGLARTAIVQATQAAWGKLSQAELTCIDEGLRQRGSSIASSVQQGILPSDARLAEVRSSCKMTSASPQPNSIYSVDGLNLYSRVVFDSTAYREYHCSPSQQFAGQTWCQKSRKDRTARGAFQSYISLLHSFDGTALYINRELQPAWFTANEATDDIERLTRKFGGQPRIISIPKKEGVPPNGLIAVWGDILLEPISSDSMRVIAAGRGVREGLLVDHVGNLRRSAQLDLPIYRLAGGPGYLWAASWDQNGVGSLQFLTVDASAFGSPTTLAAPPLVAIDDRVTKPNPSSVSASSSASFPLSPAESSSVPPEAERRRTAEVDAGRRIADQTTPQRPTDSESVLNRSNSNLAPPPNAPILRTEVQKQIAPAQVDAEQRKIPSNPTTDLIPQDIKTLLVWIALLSFVLVLVLGAMHKYVLYMDSFDLGMNILPTPAVVVGISISTSMESQISRTIVLFATLAIVVGILIYNFVNSLRYNAFAFFGLNIFIAVVKTVFSAIAFVLALNWIIIMFRGNSLRERTNSAIFLGLLLLLTGRLVNGDEVYERRRLSGSGSEEESAQNLIA